jgi:hypothetical protein
LTAAERKIAGIMRAIEDGNYNPTLTKRLSGLETDKAKAETNFSNAAEPPKLRIHPNLPALCRRKVEYLQEALSEAATQVEAGEIIRSLIDRIELTPAGDTLAIKLYGDLARIIAFSETATGNPIPAHATIGAGPRFVPHYKELCDGAFCRTRCVTQGGSDCVAEVDSTIVWDPMRGWSQRAHEKLALKVISGS